MLSHEYDNLISVAYVQFKITVYLEITPNLPSMGNTLQCTRTMNQFK